MVQSVTRLQPQERCVLDACEGWSRDYQRVWRWSCLVCVLWCYWLKSIRSGHREEKGDWRTVYKLTLNSGSLCRRQGNRERLETPVRASRGFSKKRQHDSDHSLLWAATSWQQIPEVITGAVSAGSPLVAELGTLCFPHSWTKPPSTNVTARGTHRSAGVIFKQMAWLLLKTKPGAERSQLLTDTSAWDVFLQIWSSTLTLYNMRSQYHP